MRPFYKSGVLYVTLSMTFPVDFGQGTWLWGCCVVTCMGGFWSPCLTTAVHVSKK